MPRTSVGSKGVFIPWARNVLLSVLLASLACFFYARFSASSPGTDFPDFYCASRMLIEGHGGQLYDAEAQREFQARYAGRVGTLYIHPPFETVVYLTVAWLPLKNAYLLWCLLNFAFLGLAARTAAREALLPWDWRILLIVSLAFVPVLLCFLQGQDSILLVWIVTLAFAALKRQRAFAAGCWLGLGLFKFQLVLPLVLVLVVRKGGSRFLQGVVLSALLLAGLSAGICGWSVFSVYPRFLLHLQEQPFAGIIPRAMANFRGLTFLFLGSDRSPFAIAAIAILSLAALPVTVFAWRNARPVSDPDRSGLSQPDSGHAAFAELQFDLAFATTMCFAELVSYHLNPHDLSLLLLPMVLVLRGTAGTPQPRTSPPRWLVLALSAVLFLPPLHLFALQAHGYAVVSIPLIALFAVSASWAQKAGAAQVS